MKCEEKCATAPHSSRACRTCPIRYKEVMSSPITNLYMGLDISTQQLKAVVIDDNFNVINEAKVHYDSDLPEFRTHGGVIQERDSNVVTVPTLMWVKALDMVLDRLTVSGVDFSKIIAISGSGQQHGSVYWQKGANDTLSKLDSTKFLHQQLSGSFSVQNSPIWMDSSTTEQCKKLEDVLGGPEGLQEVTGSRAYERFTGSQIMKIYQTKFDAYKATERISLVSSFGCSLFLNKIAPIDYSDGSGMNLLDIKLKTWNKSLLDVCGPNLEEKLGEPVPTCTVVGSIGGYFVERYGFDSSCQVVAFTGDNPASLIGMQLDKEWLAISLGTSDTLFLWLNKPKLIIDGHILCNPIDQNAYMAMLCFKNGSLTRERIRDASANGTWDIFNELLDSTPRGNFGNIGLYYDVQEILPFLIGDHRFNKANDKITKFSGLEVEVRALIEGQFIAKRSYAEEMGCKLGQDTKILATGGASKNKSILQVMADVFNSSVYVLEMSESAVLGAAYNAKIGLNSTIQGYNEIMNDIPEPKLVCSPYSDAESIYKPMIERYRILVNNLKVNRTN